MYKKTLGNTGLSVTPVGFGVLTIGPWQMNLSIGEGASVLRYAIDNGINLLDTAQYYKTYPYIKKALIGCDKELVIVSKCLDSTYNEMKAAVEEARYEMDRESIEIFLLHEVRSKKDWLDRRGAWDYLQEAKAKGIVKAVGISTHHVDVAELSVHQPDIDILFPLINFQSLGIRKYEGPGCKEEMAAAMAAANIS
jgi:diketogulonate reductase-like aldo/keto reductase